MPDLQELLKERNVKKFKKKEYRPWDLSGDSTSDVYPFTPLESESSNEEKIKDTNTEVKTNTLSKKVDAVIDTNKTLNRYHLDNIPDNNEKANRYPQDTTIDTNQETIRYQLDTNPDSIKIPRNTIKTSISPSKNIEFENKNAISTETQLEDGSLMILEQEIMSLSGKQKIIFDMIIEICMARNSLSTGPVQTASLASIAQTTTGTIKTMLIRLIQKQLLIRHPGKNAKGGYINLGVSTIVLELVKNIKNTNKHTLFASDIIMSNRYQKDISQEYSSNSNYNITTTNLNKKSEQIPAEWENINYEPLTHIGFSKTQIKQIIGKNDPVVVQESINHFAFGLEHNPKLQKYDEPLNVLMGVLRKSQAWVEADYRSAIEIAQEKLLAAKKAEIERKKSLEEEAFKLALSEWDSGITEQDRNKISERTHGDLTPPAAKLSKYFRENVWPSKKSEYLLF